MFKLFGGGGGGGGGGALETDGGGGGGRKSGGGGGGGGGGHVLCGGGSGIFSVASCEPLDEEDRLGGGFGTLGTLDLTVDSVSSSELVIE